MNYIKLHENFINKFKQQDLSDYKGVVERHHIVPRHLGGSDEEDNLVYLTYRQHKFIHKLRYFAFGSLGDKAAYQLMSSLKEDGLFSLRSYAGKIGGAKNIDSGHIQRLSEIYGSINGRRNVESGLLDSIRHLANNEVQLAKVAQLGRENVETGQIWEALELAWKANRGKKHSEEHKQMLSELHRERVANDPTFKERIIANCIKGNEKKKEKSKALWESVLENAERNEEFLHKKSNRALYKFVSPEGLEFESPIFAANYYGNGISSTVVENWCKRNHHGWSCYLKTEKE